MSRRRADDPEIRGVLLLDKPSGPTSHDVVSWVRWVLGVRRVGHCGTLDPDATGLLVVGVGVATKLAPYLTGQDKGYRARFVLGESTTTGDAQGQPVQTLPCPPDTETRARAALEGLRGEQRLVPPAYSAIHVQGRRAHELARAGEAPVLPPRPMTVHVIEPGPVTRVGDRVEVVATLLVSKGTYVRSLAEALGRALELPAHLGALHRTRSGALSLDHPLAVTQVVAQRKEGSHPVARWHMELTGPAGESRAAAAEYLRAHLIDPAQAVPLPVLHATNDQSGQRAMTRLASGQSVELPDPGLLGETQAGGQPGSQLAVVPAHGPGLVLVRHEAGPHGDRLQPERVIVAPPTPPAAADGRADDEVPPTGAEPHP